MLERSSLYYHSGSTMAKTVNTNTKPRGYTKPVATYMDMYSFRQIPLPEQFFEDEAIKMVKFFRDSDHALTLNSYPVHCGFHRRTFERWVKKHKVLGLAYEFSKEIIALRRETGMLLGIIKEKCNMHMMHLYSEEWDNSDKRWSALKEKEDNRDKPTNITVVMDDFTKTK